MVQFTIIVIVLSLFMCEISCVPIIKTSGVQWSEPIGTGKGNITILMIPQNNACNNDSDMIVAVKSDYQILSQDTQLLNLVVNENRGNKSGVRNNNICLHNNTDSQLKDLNDSEEFVKKDNSFVANYFEPYKKLSVQSVNRSIDQGLLKNNDYLNVSKNGDHNSVISIFKFLNVSSLNQVDVYPSSNKYQVNKKESGNANVHQNNMRVDAKESKETNNVKENSNNKHNVTVLIAKNNSAIKDPIIKQINHNMSLPSNLNQAKEEFRTSENEAREPKSNSLISKLAEDELVEKDFKHLEDTPLNLAQIEGNAQLDTTCLPFFISFSNEPPTVESDSGKPIITEGNSFQKEESKIVVQDLSRIDISEVENCTNKSRPQNENKEFEQIVQMLPASSTNGAGIKGTTESFVISVSRQECITSQETKPSKLATGTMLDSSQDTVVELIKETSTLKYVNLETINPREFNAKLKNTPQIECKASTNNEREMAVKIEYEHTSGSVLEGNMSVQKNITLGPTVNGETKICIVGESTIKSEYELTTKVFIEGNQQIQKKITLESPINCGTKTGFYEESTIKSEYELTTKVFLEGKQPMQKKITLEPPINCGTKTGVGESMEKSEYELTTNIFLGGNQPIQKKITLEPPINCETIVSQTSYNSISKNCPENGQLLQRNLTIPFEESSVVLANNNEMSKGKDIAITLNSSVDEFPWSDIQDGGERSNGRMCEQYNSNSMNLGGDQEFPQVRSQFSFIVSKNKKNKAGDNNKLTHLQSKSNEGYYCKNKIVKDNLGGNNLLVKNLSTFNVENNYTECGLNNQKTNVKVMSATHNMNSNADTSQIKPPQSYIEKTQLIVHSTLKPTTIFHNEENQKMFDKTPATPLMQHFENYETAQGNSNKECSSKTFTVPSSSQYFNKAPGNGTILFFGNVSDIGYKDFDTTPKCNKMFQTYQPSYNNHQVDFFLNTQLPSQSILLPCKRKKIKLPIKQGASKENIQLSGGSVQEIVIKLVKNTSSPKTMKKKVKNHPRQQI